jgi:hypothetical protein
MYDYYCLPDWVWVVFQMIFGGGLGGLIFQVMLVKGQDDVKFTLHLFMTARAILLGIGGAFTWMFAYIHMGNFQEITLSDIEILRVIIYSAVAGYTGLLLLGRMK